MKCLFRNSLLLATCLLSIGGCTPIPPIPAPDPSQLSRDSAQQHWNYIVSLKCYEDGRAMLKVPLTGFSSAQRQLDYCNRISDKSYTANLRTRIASLMPGISEKEKSAIIEMKPFIGMKDEVARAAMGEPHEINRTITKKKVREQWVYRFSGNVYLYFENGILTTIQG